MTVLRALAVFTALVTLASLPCLIAWLVVGADEATGRAVGTRDQGARRRGRRRRTRQASRGRAPEAPPRQRAIEQVAADLRRVSSELRDGRPLPMLRWEAGVAAYDELLREACAMLGIVEHLGELTGDGHLMDREIERLRVEGELEAAGVVLRAPAPGDRETH